MAGDTRRQPQGLYFSLTSFIKGDHYEKIYVQRGIFIIPNFIYRDCIRSASISEGELSVLQGMERM